MRGTFRTPLVMSVFIYSSILAFVTGDKFGILFNLMPIACFLLYVVFGCKKVRTYSSENQKSESIAVTPFLRTARHLHAVICLDVLPKEERSFICKYATSCILLCR